jgi:hypothetical protein
MVNKNLIYNDILFNKIKKKSSILNVDKNNPYEFNQEFIKHKNVKYLELNNFSDECTDIFDFVILYDLFSQDKNTIEEYLEKSQNILKINGYIILINLVITSYSQYVYHPFSYLQRFIFGNPVYLTTLDDTLKEYGYKIVNMSRLYSIDSIPFYPMQFFCLILKNKI